MTTTIEVRPRMANTPKHPKRVDTSVKIEKAIADAAKVVAHQRDITVAEYLSDLLRDTVEADYVEALAKLSAEAKKPKKR
jgi:hypothetical protein